MKCGFRIGEGGKEGSEVVRVTVFVVWAVIMCYYRFSFDYVLFFFLFGILRRGSFRRFEDKFGIYSDGGRDGFKFSYIE